MGSKREREITITNGSKEEDEVKFVSDSKKQRLVNEEESSPSPPPHVSIANPLSGLANNYADLDEDEVYLRRGMDDKENGESKRNGHGFDEEDDEDEEDDDEDLNEHVSVGRHSRQVEARRDCPYLDTVNRQVF